MHHQRIGIKFIYTYSSLKTNNEKKTATQRKIAKLMHEFKEGELHIGKSETIVTNPKQAIAIALSEADELRKSKK